MAHDKGCSCGSCVQPTLEKRLTAFSTAEVFEPFTEWTSAKGVDRVRVIVKVLAESGEFQGRLGVQTAVCLTDTTGAGGRQDPTTIGSQNVGEGEFIIDTNLALTTVSQFRLGWWCSLTSGSSPGQADVRMTPSFVRNVEELVEWQGQVQTDNTASYIQVLSGWVPAFGLQSLRAALVAAGVSGQVSTQLMIRTANTDPSSPNAWQSLESAVAGARQSCIDVNVTSITDPGAGTKPFWVQLGLAVQLTAGATQGYASVGAYIVGQRG
jgi:hypothetical protein